MPDIRKMGMYKLEQYREILESQLNLVYDRIDGMILSECYICGDCEYGYESIPEGWGYLKGSNHLMCKKSIETWTRVIGEAPDVFREGDEL